MKQTQKEENRQDAWRREKITRRGFKTLGKETTWRENTDGI